MTLTDDLKRSDLYERAIDAIFMEDRPSAYWVEQKLTAAGIRLVPIETEHTAQERVMSTRGKGNKMRKIYLASSWRNQQQPKILAMLRDMGHEVYDFRNPAPSDSGFSWKQCKMEWGEQIDMHDMALYVRHITTNPVAQAGFRLDRDALHWCDTCVLLLPCGRSAHLEAGYAMGQGKETFVLLSEDGFEPELMYLLGDHICETPGDLRVAFSHSVEARCSSAYGWKGE